MFTKSSVIYSLFYIKFIFWSKTFDYFYSEVQIKCFKFKFHEGLSQYTVIWLLKS